MHSSFRRIVASGLLLAVVAVPAMAQPGRGVAAAPLPDEPWEYQTAAGPIRVSVLAGGLENPWSLEFLPDDSILITERNGRLRHFKDGVLSGPVRGLPEVQADNFISGLHDIKLHPDFDANNLLYWVYNKPVGEGAPGSRAGRVLTVARGVFDGSALSDVEDIITMDGASTVSRMLFLPDGTLLVSTWGEPGEMAQNRMGLSGKILRYNDDGSIPDDNPFVGVDGYRPEIYSLGHRTPESLVWHEPTGTIWESEMGPHGGDEVNIIEAGGNYGWPLVSLGRSYAGPYQPFGFEMEGMIPPVVNFVPSISVTGMTFYDGDAFPGWQGNLFIGGVRYGEIAPSGRLERIAFNENMEEQRRESLLVDKRWRIRDVRQGPDDLLYVITDERDGALLKIEPAD
ncbi:MAG: PQQ-dependent sugar dehydrogenase [Gammaproteobacteria bacterium]|jgi:glucose/arabinose dehydrogenase